jgi:hypothetical protein
MTAAAWWQAFIDSIKSQTATWLVGFVIALLTLFSAKITENIRLALNHADLVSKYYEELAENLSEYRFQAELTVEFVERGWTTAYTLETLIKEYNESVTKLRKKEWVYQSWIRRYWGERPAIAFDQCMDAVKAFDSEVHHLNDEIEAVVITKKKEKFDPGIADAALTRLKPALAALQKCSTNLNRELE